MALGKLALTPIGRVFLLALALARALSNAARSEASVSASVAARSTLRMALPRADEIHHHRDAAGAPRLHQQRLEEGRAYVDARPFGHP